MGKTVFSIRREISRRQKAAIERILTDAELRKKLDTGAEETVKERNWKRIEPQILEQYLGK